MVIYQTMSDKHYASKYALGSSHVRSYVNADQQVNKLKKGGTSKYD